MKIKEVSDAIERISTAQENGLASMALSEMRSFRARFLREGIDIHIKFVPEVE